MQQSMSEKVVCAGFHDVLDTARIIKTRLRGNIVYSFVGTSVGLLSDSRFRDLAWYFKVSSDGHHSPDYRILSVPVSRLCVACI